MLEARIADLPDRISDTSVSRVLDHLGFGVDQLNCSRWHGKPIGGGATYIHLHAVHCTVTKGGSTQRSAS
jgi:hypothetical protein